MREFDSEQQMKQTVCCQSYTVPIYLKGKGANSSAGFEGETCGSPVIRIRSGPARGDGGILRRPLRKWREENTEETSCVFATCFAVISELRILIKLLLICTGSK